jgi:hypothetical protein
MTRVMVQSLNRKDQMKLKGILIVGGALGIVLPALAPSEQAAGMPGVRLTPEKENVVASELLGEWTVDEGGISSRLGGRSDHLGKCPIVFRSDGISERRMIGKLTSLAAELSKDAAAAKNRPFAEAISAVFLAGEVEFGEETRDFALICVYGTPRLIFVGSKGDWESENVMLARDNRGDNDLLFLGGDFNNQSFGAYHRKLKPGAGRSGGGK